MIERIHLQIIFEVARCGTLTKAAQKLNLTQSALSHTIKKLESRMDSLVWHREGRLVKLTHAGEHLLALAERLLPQFERADNDLLEYAYGGRGSLNIGMECHPCYRWLQSVVPIFLDTWPLVDIDIKQAFKFGGIGALLNHDIDILITPDPITHPRLDFRPVFAYELVLVVSEKHPLANLAYVQPEQLISETLLTYPVPIERLDIFNRFLQPANCMPYKHKTIETIEMMLQMVAANRGVAALPKWLMMEYIGVMPLKIITLGDQGIHKHINVCTRREALLQHIKGFVDLSAAQQIAG